jgi:hypothetical protein
MERNSQPTFVTAGYEMLGVWNEYQFNGRLLSCAASMS